MIWAMAFSLPGSRSPCDEPPLPLTNILPGDTQCVARIESPRSRE